MYYRALLSTREYHAFSMQHNTIWCYKVLLCTTEFYLALQSITSSAERPSYMYILCKCIENKHLGRTISKSSNLGKAYMFLKGDARMHARCYTLSPAPCVLCQSIAKKSCSVRLVCEGVLRMLRSVSVAIKKCSRGGVSEII